MNNNDLQSNGAKQPDLHKADVMPRLITGKLIIDYIKSNNNVSDYVLKKEFKNDNYENSEELYDVIDNLYYDGIIKRIYTNDSQVPFYLLNEA